MTLSGVELPVIRGYRIKRTFRLIDSLNREFPKREVIMDVPDESAMKENEERMAWNKEHPEDLKPLLEVCLIERRVTIPKGAPNFDNLTEVAKAWWMIVGESPDVKDGLKPALTFDDVMSIDFSEFECLVMDVVAAITGKKDEIKDGLKN